MPQKHRDALDRRELIGFEKEMPQTHGENLDQGELTGFKKEMPRTHGEDLDQGELTGFKKEMPQTHGGLPPPWNPPLKPVRWRRLWRLTGGSGINCGEEGVGGRLQGRK